MLKKAEGEIGVLAHPREATPQRPPQGEDLGGTQIGEIAPFEVAPELLHGVEVGRVGREAFDLQPGGVAGPGRPASAGFGGRAGRPTAE